MPLFRSRTHRVIIETRVFYSAAPSFTSRKELTPRGRRFACKRMKDEKSERYILKCIVHATWPKLRRFLCAKFNGTVRLARPLEGQNDMPTGYINPVEHLKFKSCIFENNLFTSEAKNKNFTNRELK